MSTKHLLTAAALVSALTTMGLARSDDPMVGTWKLNVEKSKNAPFKSVTVLVEPAGEGIRVTVDRVGVDGAPVKWGFTANYDDGEYHPITGSTPLGDSVALTRVDTNSARVSFRQGGKPTVIQTVVVAADGKTRTITAKGTNARGQAVDSITFYDKQ